MLETIKIGSSGDLVKVAQYLIKYSDIKKASGKFDTAFFNAVSVWQSNNGLPADGVIGPNTWTAIANVVPTCSTSKNKKSIYTCAIQILIGGLVVDGVYGTNTKNAVATYQNASGLVADGICGPKTWNQLIVGYVKPSTSSTPSAGTNQAGQTISGKKILNNCVKYLQWDSKWKNIKYSTHTSSQTIGNSGCGPTSMAMILATWENSKITPVQTCEEALKNGYRTYNSGTAWGYFKYVFKHHKCFKKYIETSSVNTLMSALREGALAVCSMNSNDNNFFTTGGHFVVARGCDDKYIYYNDPNKSETPRKHLATKSQTCLKQAFIFWPNTPEPEKEKDEIKIEPDTNVEAMPTEVNPDYFEAIGKEIIDISKWQKEIDFDKLKPKVAFVIVKASCGSDIDVKFKEYAEAMSKRNIPFGVYCYSYAGTTEKAKDEAQKIVKYAKAYNPLFYVMDAEESKITNESILAFVNELKKQKVRKTGCYVAHNHYEDYGYDSVRSKFDFTWIPRYGSNGGTIEGSKKPKYTCDLWQYTSVGKIAGIKTNVDMNVITGDGHDLAWFLS